MTLLALENVTAAYGPTRALFGVDLAVAEGEVVALMGRNGMGKTTTVRTICGLLPFGGAIRFAGQDTAPLPAHKVARLGIGLVPEGRRCFPNLSVEENLLAAARPGPWDLSRAFALFPRLEERRAQMAATLSGGEQQMVAIARALLTNPRLLILDEATEGLAPLVRAEIWGAIRRLRAEDGVGSGMAILLVDKSLRELRAVADRAVILRRGETVWQGRMEALTHDLTAEHVGV